MIIRSFLRTENSRAASMQATSLQVIRMITAAVCRNCKGSGGCLSLIHISLQQQHPRSWYSSCRSWGIAPSSGGLSLRNWSRHIRFSVSVLSFWTLQCRAVCITFIYLYYHTTSGPDPQENQPLIRPASDDLRGTQARWLRRRAGRDRRSARRTVLPEAVPLRYGECRPPSRLSRRKRRGCGC